MGIMGTWNINVVYPSGLAHIELVTPSGDCIHVRTRWKDISSVNDDNGSNEDGMKLHMRRYKQMAEVVVRPEPRISRDAEEALRAKLNAIAF